MATLKRFRIVFIVFASSFVALAPAACTKGASVPKVATTSPGASALASEAKKPPSLPDADIASAIERHMQEEGVLRSQQPKVTVTQGVADLTGTVESLLGKECALRVAETIKGVRSVIDQVVVAPITRTDEQLLGDVTGALKQDPATRPYVAGPSVQADLAALRHTVAVAVKDGKVTLSGTADSWQQKNLFADVAKGVKGVKALENSIDIQFEPGRPDSEIATDVKHRIANDVWLDGDVIGVTVTGHTVYLSGVVGSVAQKVRAHDDAFVAGVEATNDSGVTVDWLGRTTRGERTTTLCDRTPRSPMLCATPFDSIHD
jgi:osmotically-inducible protein OsmY